MEGVPHPPPFASTKSGNPAWVLLFPASLWTFPEGHVRGHRAVYVEVPIPPSQELMGRGMRRCQDHEGRGLTQPFPVLFTGQSQEVSFSNKPKKLHVPTLEENNSSFHPSLQPCTFTSQEGHWASPSGSPSSSFSAESSVRDKEANVGKRQQPPFLIFLHGSKLHS